MSSSNPFDYVNAILHSKKDLIVDEITEKAYVPFLANRGLSYHHDCVLFANEMNFRHQLDKKPQFSYLLNTIRGRKRPFMKWVKPESPDALACVKLVYGYSDTKARQAISLLTTEQLEYLADLTNLGGSVK